jgi:ASC-1-like (ASCH) protein
MNMTVVYCELIKAGRRTIESVPEKDGIRIAVQTLLNEVQT